MLIKNKGTLLKWLAIPIGMLVVLGAIYNFNTLVRENEDEIMNTTKHVTEMVQSEISNVIKVPLQSLERMGLRWERTNHLEQAVWQQDAIDALRILPALQSIGWIGLNGVIQWVEPAKQYHFLANTDLTHKPGTSDILKQASQSQEMLLTPMVSLIEGGQGFLAIKAIHSNTGLEGYVAAFFNINILFESLLRQELFHGFSFQIKQQGKLMYMRGEPLKDETIPYAVMRTLPINNVTWTVTVWPSSDVLKDMSSAGPYHVLVSGFLMAYILAVSLYSAGQQIQLGQASLEAGKAIAEANQKNNLILEKANEGFISMDAAGKIINWNLYAEKILGWSKEEVLGKLLQDFILLPEEKTEILQKIKRFMDDATPPIFDKTLEMNALNKAGDSLPLEVTIFTIHTDNEYTYHALIRDISERKMVEKMKNEFISVVSHELRTPLTAIKGSISLLTDKQLDLPDKYRKLLVIAQKNCDRLIYLINDILDIEKIEAGKIELRRKKFNVKALLEEAIRVNEAYAQKFHVKLKYESPDTIFLFADYDRLIQVLTNLISNAVKFSKAGAEVWVKAQLQADEVDLSIIDQGEGIPKAFQEKIFGKFAQADSTSARGKGGTGLGLNISKALIELHQGTIHFESQEGQGTTFHVNLPALIEAEAPVAKILTQVVGSSKKQSHILVCEDDEDCANLLRMILEKSQFKVSITHSAQEAKRVLAQQDIDAITVDLKLPDEDGISLIKDIQKDGFQIPVIVIAGEADKVKGELNSHVISIAGWLEKPINQERLETILKQVKHKIPTEKINILHVEDDPDVIKITQFLLEKEANVTAARSLHDAKGILNQQNFDLIILDLGLPDGHGASLLPIVNWETKQVTPVVVFSAYDVEKDFGKFVSSRLIKSMTSNEALINTIKSTLGKM